MRFFIFALVLASSCISCKKKEGKYCPLIEETHKGHLLDISTVSTFPGIMDTLAKYPQLQVSKINITQAVYDPTNYTANIHCYIYYKQLIIFDAVYGLSSNKKDPDYQYGYTKISNDIPISVLPAISLGQANAIAKKAVNFENCTISILGIMNYGSDSIPNYKLIWRIKESELGYPNLDMDAQSGEILTINETHPIIY